MLAIEESMVKERSFPVGEKVVAAVRYLSGSRYPET
jgi:hypothetical protein